MGELGKARSGIGFPDAEQGGKEGVPFYKVSDMNNAGNEHEMVVANNYVTREQIARRGWKPIDEVPSIFFAKVGAAVLLNRKRLCRFPFLLDNNTMAYSIDGSALDADFAKTLFETIDLTSLVQVGALPSYNSGDVENIDVVIPEMHEQRKIGAYFKSVDNLITLHQRKYDKLVNIKKAMLDKMFPKNGKNVPEIRFRGFTDAWEQRKYKRTDLVPEGSGAVTFSPADIDDDGHLSLINNTYISFEKYEESPEIKVKEGDILFTKTASIGKIAYVSKLREKSTINPQFALLTPNKSVDGYFLFLSLRTEDCLKYVRDISGGSSIPTMSQEKLKEMKIICPTLKEQQIIGEYYQKLDNLITLHQRKLEKLKQIKKSLLDKMFI